MNGLEREYRTALARYPRAWRRNHEQALLGVLLDNAEAEGRHQMSTMDRKDLAANGRRRRASHAVTNALFAVAALALLGVASLLLGGAAPETAFFIATPAVSAPPVGGSYQPLLTIGMPGWVLYAMGIGLLVPAAFTGLVSARRNARIDRVQ